MSCALLPSAGSSAGVVVEVSSAGLDSAGVDSATDSVTGRTVDATT